MCYNGPLFDRAWIYLPPVIPRPGVDIYADDDYEEGLLQMINDHPYRRPTVSRQIGFTAVWKDRPKKGAKEKPLPTKKTVNKKLKEAK